MASPKGYEGDGKEKEKQKKNEDCSRKDRRHDGFDRREESNSVKKGRERESEQYHNYTPLTVYRAEIYKMHKKGHKWQQPRKVKVI